MIPKLQLSIRCLYGSLYKLCDTFLLIRSGYTPSTLRYFRFYRIPEYRAAAWVKSAAGNLTVAGDVKTLYLLKYYFNVNVDAFQGLKYLTGKGAQKP
jgi:hypothetical protein